MNPYRYSSKKIKKILIDKVIKESNKSIWYVEDELYNFVSQEELAGRKFLEIKNSYWFFANNCKNKKNLTVAVSKTLHFFISPIFVKPKQRCFFFQIEFEEIVGV